MKHLSAKHGALLAFSIIQRSLSRSFPHIPLLSSASRCVWMKKKMSEATVEIANIQQSFAVKGILVLFNPVS